MLSKHNAHKGVVKRSTVISIQPSINDESVHNYLPVAARHIVSMAQISLCSSHPFSPAPINHSSPIITTLCYALHQSYTIYRPLLGNDQARTSVLGRQWAPSNEGQQSPEAYWLKH